MNKQNLVLCVLMVVGLLVAGTALVQHRVLIHPVNDVLAEVFIESANPVAIQRINVIQSNEFDLILEDGRRVHCLLGVNTVPDSKNRVLEFLNTCTKPRAILKKKDDKFWVGEIYVTVGDVEISLSKWLQDKKLTFD